MSLAVLWNGRQIRINECQASLVSHSMHPNIVLIGTNQLRRAPMSPINFGKLQTVRPQHVTLTFMRQLSNDAAIVALYEKLSRFSHYLEPSSAGDHVSSLPGNMCLQ